MGADPNAGRRGGRLLIGAGALVLIVALAAAAWFAWMPAHRPGLGDGETYGVDVSAYQRAIDWQRVAGDDISFAYIKATEGADLVDRRFAENWDGAGKAGLQRGAYHFFTLCRPGTEQAANFISAVPHAADALPPALDLELGGNCARRPARADVEREVADFIDAVERHFGREVVLYVGDDWEAVYPTRERLDRPLWYRRILRTPPTKDWLLWQFNYRAAVDGIEGGADLNIMRADTAS